MVSNAAVRLLVHWGALMDLARIKELPHVQIPFIYPSHIAAGAYGRGHTSLP